MLRHVYDTVVRPFLPRKVIVHNGIPAKTGRLLDANDHREDWENILMESIRQQVVSGQSVVEVGGGIGVCTAELAKRAGRSGSVVTYEGDPDRCQTIRETLALNKVQESVEVHNQLVDGETRLPSCDVLVLDCEGDEVPILNGDYGTPETVIVETHPIFGVDTETVVDSLEDDGYTIQTIREGSGIDIVEATQ